jgi:ABC-type dipeptide/oligopeptide/nickel transport system permease subunit
LSDNVRAGTSGESGLAVAQFAAKRVVGLAAVLLVISFGTFGLLTIAPGDTAQLLLGTREQSPEVIASVREEYHLDKPFLEQYGIWLSHAARLDFGRSIRTQEPVLGSISSRLGLSLFLGIYATLISLLVGVPLGILAAVKRRQPIDRAVVGLGVVGVSTPAFTSGVRRPEGEPQLRVHAEPNGLQPRQDRSPRGGPERGSLQLRLVHSAVRPQPRRTAE